MKTVHLRSPGTYIYIRTYRDKYYMAGENAVYDHFLTLSWALMFAPLLASRASTSKQPREAATIRGVLPPYQRHTETLYHS